MATSQAASSGTAAAVGGTANAIGETIVGSHLMKIECFSGTKDLGVGKSIKSSTFRVGGYDWYIECYPCGVDEENIGCVSLFVCLSSPKKQVEAECYFFCTPVDDDDGDYDGYSIDKHTYNAETSWRCGSDVMERANLESLLKDDCLHIRCDVYIVREFPSVPPPDPHRPLSDLASGMPGDLATNQVGGELFTVDRGLLRGASTHMAASPSATSAAGASTAPTMCAENIAGSHVLTIEGYSNVKKSHRVGECLSSDSECFHVGEHTWKLELYPSGKNVKDTDCLPIFLVQCSGPAVKVRFELTLLTLAREVISSKQSCYAFGLKNWQYGCYFLRNMEVEYSPLLRDCFHIKCDVTIVNEITAVQPPDLRRHFGDLLASQVGADVEFEVGGELFPAHKCVLATRSTAFMAKFFAPRNTNITTSVNRVLVDDMEPRVFKALLHFIYTDSLPEVHHDDDDKIQMAQGLLVAADRYAMERLKLICADMLCTYVNEAGTAVATLELAYKHGCRRLMEACIKLLKGHFPKVAP